MQRYRRQQQQRDRTDDNSNERIASRTRSEQGGKFDGHRIIGLLSPFTLPPSPFLLMSLSSISIRRPVLAIVLFAIVLTPGGDPISPLILSGVMFLLFEASLLIIRTIRR